MKVRPERYRDAVAIAAALDRVYPSYKFVVYRPKRAKLWAIKVCDARSGVVLKAFAEI